jgi:hypothetical protein
VLLRLSDAAVDSRLADNYRWAARGRLMVRSLRYIHSLGSGSSAEIIERAVHVGFNDWYDDGGPDGPGAVDPLIDLAMADKMDEWMMRSRGT